MIDKTSTPPCTPAATHQRPRREQVLRCDLLAHLGLFGVSALGYLKLLERWVRGPPPVCTLSCMGCCSARQLSTGWQQVRGPLRGSLEVFHHSPALHQTAVTER